MKNIYSAFSCYLLFLIFTLSFVGNIYAKPSAVVKLSIERVENKKGRETLILPYVFSTDELGTVFGVGGMVTGLHQKQMTLGGTVFGGSETKGLALGL